MDKRINPAGRYRISDAAKLMEVCRQTLYNLISADKIKDDMMLRNGKPMHFIRGLEIIKFNNNRFYEPI